MSYKDILAFFKDRKAPTILMVHEGPHKVRLTPCKIGGLARNLVNLGGGQFNDRCLLQPLDGSGRILNCYHVFPFQLLAIYPSLSSKIEPRFTPFGLFGKLLIEGLVLV